MGSKNYTSGAARPATELAGLIPGEDYRFPHHKLRRTALPEGKEPLVLVACGSFSPLTYLHLRMFEMASDFVRFNTDFEVCGGYLSPVSDAYKKVGLAAGRHRVNMCAAAVEESSWLMVDPFETAVRNTEGEPQYVPTAHVLAHFDREINTVLGGIGGKRARICLLAGSDLIQTMSTPNLWSPADLDVILGSYGAFIVERSGTDIEEALASLRQYEDNIWVISQVIQNDISSVIPEKRSICPYIDEHGLFREGNPDSAKGKSLADASPSPSKAESSKA